LAKIERAEDGPLAGALLACRVQNLIDERLSVFVFFGKDLARYLDQITVEFTLVPFDKDLR